MPTLLHKNLFTAIFPLAACRLPLAACRLPLAACRLPPNYKSFVEMDESNASKTCDSNCIWV
jgi:hypothetical protein